MNMIHRFFPRTATATALVGLLCISAANAAPPRAALVNADSVNVRAQGRLLGEVLGQLDAGARVEVLEELTLKNPTEKEPEKWAKIRLPEGIHVWTATRFIDLDGVVIARRLNLRGGPGENYSVIGRIEKGHVVSEVSRKGDWVEIKPPAAAFAFVAAQFLEIQEELIVEGGETSDAPPTETTPTEDAVPPVVAEEAPEPIATDDPAEQPADQPIEASPSVEPLPLKEIPVAPIEIASEPEEELPVVTLDSGDLALIPLADEPTLDAAPVLEEVPTEPKENETPRRVVRREGRIGSTLSIQAPSYFRLKNQWNGKTMNYVRSKDPKLNLKNYRDRNVIIRGEEFIDPRWPKTPVLVIDLIETLR